jgi:hypothetical protein
MEDLVAQVEAQLLVLLQVEQELLDKAIKVVM